MSGTSYGGCLLHCSPEAAIGGPLALSGTWFGFDFNPASGGIRIISSAVTGTGQNNFRFNAAGTVLTTDTTLAYAAAIGGLRAGGIRDDRVLGAIAPVPRET